MTRLAIACAFFFLSFHATAQTYYSCDFENGIPADFVLNDYDQNVPSASMKKLGFDVGKPWISVATNKAATSHAACSTSWYATAGTSDDWMVTPVITISGSSPVLSWKAMAADALALKTYNPQQLAYVCTPLADYSGDVTVTMRVKANPAASATDDGYVELSGSGINIQTCYGGYDGIENAKTDDENTATESLTPSVMMFVNLATGESAGITETLNNSDVRVVARYTADGQLVSAPVKGLNILKLSNGKTMKVMVK